MSYVDISYIAYYEEELYDSKLNSFNINISFHIIVLVNLKKYWLLNIFQMIFNYNCLERLVLPTYTGNFSAVIRGNFYSNSGPSVVSLTVQICPWP